MTEATTTQPTLTPVWDLGVRLFHWALALTVGLAALTGFLGEADTLRIHITAGLIAAALVIARIVWGFFGPTHARFADFLPDPAAIRAHLNGADARHLGHNPLGALMVFAMLAAVLVLAGTGLVILGGVLRLGPLAASFGPDAGFGARELHEMIAFCVVALIAAHLAGVVFESRRSRENLARAMLTGVKESRPGDVPVRETKAQLLMALLLIAALGASFLTANAALSHRPVPGLPVTQIDATTAAECGACHMAYPPSLLPAASWQALMAGLSDHFGEDASLPPATAAQIESWLTANAAETVQTLPARIFARTDAKAPFTLTETPAWKRIHGDLPEALFRAKPVASRANCAACHHDAATGRFSPFAIAIPKE
ncbi:cytochrome b [Rhodobacter viridis]|uniref:Cytochrome b n=1 Tax=Rhodobacter viridis TaxID=1054202 RepID=A0A318TZ65_9RHOB|nr:cytochrome b/b6 domain-containing protein [Rhodobacter viridis]PYF07405.1 cytochrome b [Rhodobacter viridis]